MKQSIDILSKYFNNIVFIDDNFIINRETKDTDTDVEIIFDDFDPTSITSDQTASSIQPQEPNSSYSPFSKNTVAENIYKLLDECKKDNINIFPYIFKENDSMDNIINFLDNANLIILDWELLHSSPKKTIEIINTLSQQNILRFVIIYTNEPDLSSIQYQLKTRFSTNYLIIDEKNNILKIGSIYTMICSKNILNIRQALEQFNSILIEKYGYLFISFFDLSQQIHNQTSKVLSDFMHPFESLLTLQLKSDSALNEENYEEHLRNIILNHLNDNIKINCNIITGMICNYKSNLENLKNKDFKNIKNSIKNSIKNKPFFTENKTTLKKLYNNFTKDHFVCLLDNVLENNLYMSSDKRNAEFNKLLEKIKNDCTLDKEEFKSFRSNIELFLLTALFNNSANIDLMTANLLKLMKLIPYTKNNWIEIINNLSINIKSSDKFKTKATNILHCGDILANEKDGKFLLCITPPCDTFRPTKVNFNIKYILGKIVNEIPNNSKESVHYSVLPLNNKVITVEWCMFNEKIFNLKNNNDLDILKKYNRPYRLQKEYIQQIISKSISFWSRSGVNEVFIKNTKHSLGSKLCRFLTN